MILKSVINFIWKKKKKIISILIIITLIFLFKTFSFIRFETLNQLKFYVSFLFKGQK